MKTRKLDLLFVLVLLLWIVPWQGKHFWPQWFGSKFIQWPTAVALGVLCPIGALFALSLLAGPSRRAGFFYFVGFTVPILVFLFMFGISVLFLVKAETLLHPSYKEFGAIEKLAQAARETQMTPEERVEAASRAYGAWGVTLVIMDANNQFKVYEPTAKAEHLRKESMEAKNGAENTLASVRRELEEFFLVVALFPGVSIVVFIIGLGFYAFRPLKGTI